VVFIKGMECYKVDYNDNLERINARSSRSDRAMALVGAVDAVQPQRGEAGERRYVIQSKHCLAGPAARRSVAGSRQPAAASSQ
jgi:hypothetical protein